MMLQPGPIRFAARLTLVRQKALDHTARLVVPSTGFLRLSALA